MIADRDSPALELAAVAVDGAQLHHHLIRVELDQDIDLVLRLQRQPVGAACETHGLLVELGQGFVDGEVV